MGKVYLAFDHRLKRMCAQKVLDLTEIRDQALERFIREAQITAALEHPCIPAVYDYGTTAQGEYFLLMEVVRGQTLKQRVKEIFKGGAEPGETRRLLEALVKVGEAVAYAHSQGVIHRDLKSENVMIGRFGEVMVLDWGLACVLEQAGPWSVSMPGLEDDFGELTMAGQVMGTPGYMPAEQAAGESVDVRADVFALAAIAVEILTGSPPVSGGSALNRLARTSKGLIDSPGDRGVTGLGELEWVLREGLAFDREERTESAERWVSRLRAYLAGELVEGYRYSPRERVARWVRRRPGRLLVLLLLSLALVLVGLAFEVLQQSRAELRAATRREAEEKGRAQRLLLAAQSFNEALALASRRSQFSKIEALVEAAIEASSHSEESYLRAVEVYQSSGQAALETRAIERCLERYPQSVDTLIRLHARELRAGADKQEFTPTLGLISRVCRSRGIENEYTLFVEILRARGEGRWREVIALCDRILDRYSKDFHWAYFQRGRARFESKDFQAALEDFERAVELEPGFALGHQERGKARYQVGDFEGARASYERAIELQPNNGVARFLRALTYEATGDEARALQGYNEAIWSAPRLASAYFYRGRLYARSRAKEAALRDLDRAIELAPKWPDIYEARGRLNLSLGDKGAAVRDLKQFVKMAPGHPEAAKVQGLLRSFE